MKIMKYLKQVLIVLITITVTTGCLTFLGIANAKASFEDNDNYYFDEWMPGKTYHAQITQYQRYGPLKDEIESQSELLFGPESSKMDIEIMMDENGDLAVMTYDVLSSTGEIWYTYTIDAVKGITIHNSQADVNTKGPDIPVHWTKKSDQSRPHYGDVYTQLGWEKVGEKIFNNRNVIIFHLNKPVQEQQLLLQNGDYATPVTYDILLVTREYETLIDSISGVVIASSVHGVDASGNRTLLQYFCLDKLEQVNK